MPAQELSEAGKYLAAAYGVFVALLLVYFSIMAVRLSRVERQLTELNELSERGREDGETADAAREKEHV